MSRAVLASLWLVIGGCQFHHGMLIDGDGSVIGGELEIIDAATPRRCTLVLGSDHSCAVRTSDSTVWCVGGNAWGELGRGNIGGTSTTVGQVMFGSVQNAANRFFHSCASFADGTGRCWGQNDRGQLGDNTINSSGTPVTVMNLTGVAQIAAGRSFNCARRTDSSITCWGDNASGQLGDGTFTPQRTPITGVVDLPAAPIELVLGSGHACVLYADRSGSCWGTNTYGQLGDNTMTNRERPIALPIANVRQVATNGYQTGTALGAQSCALRMTGTVACWGSNEFGQLGTGSTSNPVPTPTEVTGVTGAVEIVMGRYHVCVRDGAGLVSCWGRNEAGELGDNTMTNRAAPVPVQLPRPAVHIAAGGYHSCALLDDDSLYCWGANFAGQLADGSTTLRMTPRASTLCP